MTEQTTIQTLFTERDLILNRSAAIADLAGDAGRDLTDDEITQQTTYLDAVEKLDRKIGVAERTEALSSARSTPVVDVETATPDAPSGVTVNQRVRMPGELFAMRALAMFHGRGNAEHAASWAKSEMSDPVLENICRAPKHELQRATTDLGLASAAGWASELVEYARAVSEFVELLRARTAMLQIATRAMSFERNDSITIPRMTTGISGAWINGEAEAITVEAEAFDELTLTPKKIGCIIAVSKELVNRSNPDIVRLMISDLLAGISNTVDGAFLDDAAAASGVPAGIFQGGGTAAGASATPVRDDINTDILAALVAMSSALMPRPWSWVMEPTQFLELSFVRDANGQYLYRDEIQGGTLFGNRIVQTDNPIGVGAGGATNANVGLIASDQIIVATGRGQEISISEDATINMDTTPGTDIGPGGSVATPVRSLWQTDSLAARSVSEWDFLKRHSAATYLITATNWS